MKTLRARPRSAAARPVAERLRRKTQVQAVIRRGANCHVEGKLSSPFPIELAEMPNPLSELLTAIAPFDSADLAATAGVLDLEGFTCGPSSVDYCHLRYINPFISIT
jgi:hypothetical protein